MVIAHRGASGYRPEHTRVAFELAIAQGADAVEPDLVATSDGIVVVRHENEISGTTDVASRPEFAHRRTTKFIDGETLDGWFTEDFSWAELSTLRAVERLAPLRLESAEHSGTQPILRLRDLLRIVAGAGRPIVLVAEIKHPTYFESIGIPLGRLITDELESFGFTGADRVIFECFELTALLELRARAVEGKLVYLIDDRGCAADSPEVSYEHFVTDEGLAALARQVDGISVNKSMLLAGEALASEASGSDLVARAHRAGLGVFVWTLRPENAFLDPRFRRGTVTEFGCWRGEFLALMRLGVDAVFADHPDLALEARATLVSEASPRPASPW